MNYAPERSERSFPPLFLRPGSTSSLVLLASSLRIYIDKCISSAESFCVIRPYAAPNRPRLRLPVAAIPAPAKWVLARHYAGKGANPQPVAAGPTKWERRNGRQTAPGAGQGVIWKRAQRSGAAFQNQKRIKERTSATMRSHVPQQTGCGRAGKPSLIPAPCTIPGTRGFLVFLLRKRVRGRRHVPGARRDDVIQRAEQFRQIAQSVQLCLEDLARHGQSIEHPPLPVADDTVHVHVMALLPIVPLTRRHLGYALNLSGIEIVSLCFGHTEQRRRQIGAFGRNQIVGDAGERIAFQRRRLPYAQVRMEGDDLGKKRVDQQELGGLRVRQVERIETTQRLLQKVTGQAWGSR